jgi:hypothetical protein
VSGITAANKTYDGTTAAVVNTTGAAASFLAGDVVTVNATGAFIDKNAGNNKVVNLTSTFGGADVGNYAITQQATTTASITPLAISVVGTVAANKAFDGNTAAVTSGGLLQGVLVGDDVLLKQTGAFIDPIVGTDKRVDVRNVLGGADAGNYQVPSVSTTASIFSNEAAIFASQTTLAANGGTRAALQSGVGDASAGEALAAGHQNLVANVVANGAGAPLGGYVLAAISPEVVAPISAPDSLAVATVDLNTLPPTAAGLPEVVNQVAMAEPQPAPVSGQIAQQGAGNVDMPVAILAAVEPAPATAPANGQRSALSVNPAQPTQPPAAVVNAKPMPDAGTLLPVAQAGTSGSTQSAGRAVGQVAAPGGAGQSLPRAAGGLTQAPVVVADAGSPVRPDLPAGAAPVPADASASGAAMATGVAAAASGDAAVPIVSEASAPANTPTDKPLSKTIVVLSTLGILAAGLALGKRLFGRKPDA